MMTVPLKIGLKTWWMGIMRIIAFTDYVSFLPESPPIFVIGPVPWQKLVSIFKSTNVPTFAYHKTQQRMEMLETPASALGTNRRRRICRTGRRRRWI